MEKILSIVIPTYNMEKYLRHCLDSLLINQGLEDIEVLVINDGSKDSSFSIAREYESRYPKTFKVIDKENGNYGSCINRSLKEAHGKYIKVLDADDSFDTKNFSKYVSVLKEIDVDLVITNFSFVNENGEVINKQKYDYLQAGVVLDFETLCKKGMDLYRVMMHAITYKRDNLITMNYHQTEGVSYTDNQWVFTPMLKVKDVFYLDLFLYLYLIGREGQTVDKNVEYKNFKQDIIVTIDMIKQLESVSDKNPTIEKSLIDSLNKRIRWIYGSALIYGNNIIDPQLLIEFDDYLKNNQINLYNNVQKTHIGGRFLKFYYVKYWRNHSRKPIPNIYFWPFMIYSSI